MTTTPSPAVLTAVSDERLAELIEFYASYGDDAICCDEVTAALRELQRLRRQTQSAGWRPWKAGDEMPPPGWYWVMSGDPNYMLGVSEDRHTDGNEWGGSQEGDVFAYWTIPLPPPYKPHSPATESKE